MQEKVINDSGEQVTVSCQSLSFVEFTAQYGADIIHAKLFELSLPWLKATHNFMLPQGSEVFVHCLSIDNLNGDKQISIAWPLVHATAEGQLTSKPQVISLTSFYSAVTEPMFFMVPEKTYVKVLLSYISEKYPWKSMQLGALEQGVALDAIRETFPYQRVYSQAENFYQAGIADYEEYYQQRPSQLRNTIKRREKKLAKSHQYRTDIITKRDDFSSAFKAYQAIYRQSWKSDEFSFEFIEQVCLAAIAEDKLRLGILYVDEESAAAQLWFLQSADSQFGGVEKTASIFKLAYTPQYQQYSVGSILSLAISQYVINRDKVSTIEFGMGSEPYKKDWLADSRMRQTLQIFNPAGIYGKLAIIRYLFLPRILSHIVNSLLRKRK